MADVLTFKLTGVNDVVRRLRFIGPRLERKGIRRAGRVAMTIVRDAARDTAKLFDDPETDMSVWRRITVRDGRRRADAFVTRVGVAGGARSSRSKDPPWYWRLVEFGTEKTLAQPFMRPALDNNAEAVAARFTRELNAQIDKLVWEL